MMLIMVFAGEWRVSCLCHNHSMNLLASITSMQNSTSGNNCICSMYEANGLCRSQNAGTRYYCLEFTCPTNAWKTSWSTPSMQRRWVDSYWILEQHQLYIRGNTVVPWTNRYNVQLWGTSTMEENLVLRRSTILDGRIQIWRLALRQS